MSEEEEKKVRQYIIVLWTTKDDKEHHTTFSEDNFEDTIKKVEKHCKQLWQVSALSEVEENGKTEEWKRNNQNIIKHMSVFTGKHLHWDKEEMPVVKKFKLKIE